MRLANKAVIRKLCPIPTVDEFLHDLIQPKIFSKLHTKWAYHQIELASTLGDIKTSWPLWIQTRWTGWPESQYCRCFSLNNPSSVLNDYECRVWVKICSPSPVLVTSPNEWKILEWNEKPQTNEKYSRNCSRSPKFPGTCNSKTRFLVNLSTMLEPLKRLLRKDQRLTWGCEQYTTIKNLKNAQNWNTLM